MVSGECALHRNIEFLMNFRVVYNSKSATASGLPGSPLSPFHLNGNNITPGIYKEAVKRHFWTFWSAYNFVGEI